MLTRTLSLLITLCFISNISAQKLDHVLGEVMVRIQPEANIGELVLKNQTFAGAATQLTVKELVSDHLDIWLLKFDFNAINEFAFAAYLNQDPIVETIQQNHLLELRSTTPNDPQFNQQWQYINNGQSGGTPGADIDIELAWDITTGGKTANGDEIVVCVVDNGLDPTHSDFGSNIWFNRAEIPNNNIDDDGNGFIDDYKGYNTGSNNDDIDDLNWHGTPVAGIIGARGNNNRGVAGVNWDVKLMIVVGGTGVESEVLEAYSYPLEMRKKYNTSGGRDGAFVVATNSSWGVDGGQPSSAPLWCAFYDTLGVHGILSMGATANVNSNIDLDGDLPTACPSDYMVAVTNMNDDDRKVTQAGYGATTIDLGAFGEGTHTVADLNSYGGFGGTSGATPHVTGAVALLYSAPCPEMASLAMSDPGAAALLMRQYILEGVDPLPALDGITTTGGRLNINNSMQLLMNNCGGCIPAFSFNKVTATDTEVTLNWSQNEEVLNADLRYRLEGAMTWDTITNVAPPYTLTNLQGCDFYEVEVKTFCADTLADWSNPYVFKTDGCCDQPIGLEVITGSGSSAGDLLVDWQPVLAATAYNLDFRPHPDSAWATFVVNAPPLLLPELENCFEYDFRIESQCTPDSMSGFTNARTIEASCDCPEPMNVDTMNVTGNSATFSWDAVENAFHYSMRYKIIGRGGWTRIDTTATEVTIEGLEDCTNYRLQVRSRCNIRNSQYGDSFDFAAFCPVSTADFDQQSAVAVFPNPFSTDLQIDLRLTQRSAVAVSVLNVQGKEIAYRDFGSLTIGDNLLKMNNLHELATGVYFIKIQTEAGLIVKRVVKR